MQELSVEVWSDIACPWCSIGKRRLETAIARFAAPEAVRVRWRAFELDPEAPRVVEPPISYAERLARKYGTTTERGQEMIDTMVTAAASEGLVFDFDRIRPGNTFDAHRLVHLAGTRGLADAAKQRLLLAYMTEGAAIGEHEVLVELGASLGLDPDEVRAMLAGDAHARAVRADEEAAQARGIGGVPHFVIGGRYALSGAQPPEVLLNALNQAWAEIVPDSAPESRGGVACEPDGCG